MNKKTLTLTAKRKKTLTGKKPVAVPQGTNIKRVASK